MVFFCHDWLEFTLNHIQHADFTNKYVQMTRKKHDWLVVSTPLKNISQWEGFSDIFAKPSRIDPESIYIYRWIQLQCTTIPFLALGGQILFWTLPNDTPLKPQGPLLRVHINDILRAHLWSFPIKYIIIPMPELWNHRVHSHVASCRHWCQKRMRMTRILSPAQMASLGPRTAHKSSPIGSMVLVRGGAP